MLSVQSQLTLSGTYLTDEYSLDYLHAGGRQTFHGEYFDRAGIHGLEPEVAANVPVFRCVVCVQQRSPSDIWMLADTKGTQ